MNFRDTPAVVKNIIIINVLVFVLQNILETQGIPLEYWGAMWAKDTGNFKIWQVVTHLFMHAGIWHIAFNMFTLWMFGSILENYWGSKRFFNFYMICGIMAGLTQLFIGHFTLAVGASGAIMGVMAAFAYLFPNTPLYIMFIPIPVKAKYAILGLMAIDLFGGIAQMQGDNIAHWAHLGGAVAGLILVILTNKTNRNTFY